MRKTGFWKTDWFLGLVVSCVMLVAASSDLIRSLERKAYDLGVQASSRIPLDRVAVIAIDDSSIANIGRWPWPRDRLAKMTDLLARGYVDTFRHLHPDARDRYTWWSYMMNSRAKNVGWRIDYFLVSSRISHQVLAADIDDGVMGSDHCPVLLTLDV